jgi:hypothetical protein
MNAAGNARGVFASSAMGCPAPRTPLLDAEGEQRKTERTRKRALGMPARELNGQPARQLEREDRSIVRKQCSPRNRSAPTTRGRAYRSTIGASSSAWMEWGCWATSRVIGAANGARGALAPQAPFAVSRSLRDQQHPVSCSAPGQRARCCSCRESSRHR